jgi:aerobic carbon-monoxide dehydrogenase medium subunit
MKTASFNYYAPSSVTEACTLLKEKENSKLIAGGQSLMPMMNFRVVQPDHLIDINRIPELCGIQVAVDQLEIGAMTRQCDIAASDLIAATVPLMTEALGYVGHQQTRNRGTIGGSLCHMDPAAELMTVCAVMDARLTVVSADKTRVIPIKEWSLGYLTPQLENNELLSRVSIKPWPKNHGYAFEEFARRHGDFAIVGVAVLITVDSQNLINRLAIAVCGCDFAPLRLHDVEKALVGKNCTDSSWDIAVAMARQIAAMDDAYVSSQYRQHLAGVLVKRALQSAASRLKQV